ncbi:alpha/beta fold hydrolase [Methylovirgula sp. 4M-Z18]|uniref:alpha/beta fold hydrolase n=1 Tax=Methylovirgula sp. 4M-Z18 TaxID=2293567 RepID=UPI001313E94A|nr:alpha/beta hydrolase [Methylovirgula sp. 4M-Z18]
MTILLVALALLSLLVLFNLWQTRRIERRFPPTGAFIDLPGGRLHYTKLSPVQEPRANVLLLHGASGNQADMIAALGPQLVAAGYQVIAIDRPGHGWSDRFSALVAASPSGQAALIHAALAKIGITRSIVAGFSWSGALANTFALQHRDFTQGLVLLAPATHPWPGGKVNWYYAPAAKRILGEIFCRLLVMPVGLMTFARNVAHVFLPNEIPQDYIARANASLILRTREFKANAQDMVGLYDYVCEQSQKLHEIAVPTAILTGDRDQIVYADIHSYNCARAIPGATLKVLPGVGHSVHYAAPDAVLEAIADVFAKSRGAGELALAL